MVSRPGVFDLPATSQSIVWVPRAARGVFVASVIYGILYFGGKWMSGDTFFWQRLLLSVWEVILLTSFVWFLWRHTGFVLTMHAAAARAESPVAASATAPSKAGAMAIDRRLLANLVRFLWQHAPVRLKYLLVALALVAGLTRDLVMVVINQAAGSAPTHAMQVWLPLFVLLLAVFTSASYGYQVLTTVVTTEVINRVRARLIDKILAVQPTVVETYERGTLYHIMTTDVAIVAGTTTTLLSLLPLFVFLVIAIPQLFYYSLVAGLLSVLVMIGGVLVYYFQQQSMASLGMDARKLEVTYFENVSELLGEAAPCIDQREQNL
jgi:ABC-type multidrug transport system fused ATPase/permease subunit